MPKICDSSNKEGDSVLIFAFGKVKRQWIQRHEKNISARLQSVPIEWKIKRNRWAKIQLRQKGSKQSDDSIFQQHKNPITFHSIGHLKTINNLDYEPEKCWQQNCEVNLKIYWGDKENRGWENKNWWCSGWVGLRIVQSWD